MTTENTGYEPACDRYDGVPMGWFRRCGRSGLLLPAVSLGMWHNFGEGADEGMCRRMCYTAFDHGITHFDLANSYGPPGGAAEERMGGILKAMPRNELVIATKAGYRMWPGPYGEWGSRKYLFSSLDASLERLGVDYVDIFYSHRPDPDTPLEETLGALDHAVRSGKALYAGISSYSGRSTLDAIRLCQVHGMARPVIHQPVYNLFARGIEKDLLDVTGEHGLGVIAFCPLAQGQLTSRYLDGIPPDSRAASRTGFLRCEHIVKENLDRVRRLEPLARARGQTIAQMALSWTLRDGRVTSALTGASRPEQILENVRAAEKTGFGAEELAAIDAAMA